jgi:polysaccharide biosynthesis transport protein
MSTEPGQKLSQESSSYGYTYAAGGYGGYGESGDSGSSAQRTLQDYLLVLRERIWYIVVVFLVVFSSAVIYTLSLQRQYQSSVTLQILRRDPMVMQVQQVVDTDIRSAEDLNTQMKVIESARIIQRVADRIKGDDLRAFWAPIDRTTGDNDLLPVVLARNRKVIPQRLTLVVVVSYTHPDRFVAAKVANLFAEEYLAHNLSVRNNEGVKAVDDLKATIEEQQKRVERMASDLQAYREKTIMVSLDQRKDIVNESLKSANIEAGKAGVVLGAAEVRVNQLKELKAKKGDLVELPFIAINPLIGTLTTQLAKDKIALAILQQRFRKGHPKYIEAANAVEQTERELEKAIVTATAGVESEYQNALKNYERQQEELAKRRQESLELDRAALEYNYRERAEDQRADSAEHRRAQPRDHDEQRHLDPECADRRRRGAQHRGQVHLPQCAAEHGARGRWRAGPRHRVCVLCRLPR